MSLIPWVCWFLIGCGDGGLEGVEGAGATTSGNGEEPYPGWATRLRVDVDGVQKDWEIGTRVAPQWFMAAEVAPEPGAVCREAVGVKLYPNMQSYAFGLLMLFAYDLDPQTVTPLPEAPFGRGYQPFVTGDSWPGEDPGTVVVLSGGKLQSDIADEQAVFTITDGALCFEREPGDDVYTMKHADCEPFAEAVIVVEGHLAMGDAVEGIGITELPSGERLCSPLGL